MIRLDNAHLYLVMRPKPDTHFPQMIHQELLRIPRVLGLTCPVLPLYVRKPVEVQLHDFARGNAEPVLIASTAVLLTCIPHGGTVVL